jgi:hypothetical protein
MVLQGVGAWADWAMMECRAGSGTSEAVGATGTQQATTTIREGKLALGVHTVVPLPLHEVDTTSCCARALYLERWRRSGAKTASHASHLADGRGGGQQQETY